MRLTLAVALAVPFLPSIARADGGVDTVTVDLTMTAYLYSNPTTEQFQGTFEYDPAAGQTVDGRTNSSGPLGSFSFFSALSSPLGYSNVDWSNAEGDTINFQYNYDHDTPISLGSGGGQMFWTCESSPCVENFGSWGQNLGTFAVTDPPMAAPEPSAWLMLATGIQVVLALAGLSPRKASTSF
jgi:hypothetical protein